MKNIKTIKRILIILILPVFLLATSCNNDPVVPNNPAGKVKFEFKHFIDNKEIIFDELQYTNEAGNNYLVSEIQYFISDVALLNDNGESIDLTTWEDIHYVDTDISESASYTFKDEIPIGVYSGIRFTFGITEEKNQSLMFVNPPESYMFWPENLGGGYHYMKLNGKWLNEENQMAPFNFHFGIGQIYYSYPDSITGFVQNYFEVDLPEMTLEITNDQTSTIEIIMNVDKWFTSPHIYDHNYWGGDIMQNQDAMKQGLDNGHDVFTYIIKK